MNNKQAKIAKVRRIEKIKQELLQVAQGYGDIRFYAKDPTALEDNAMMIYRERFEK